MLELVRDGEVVLSRGGDEAIPVSRILDAPVSPSVEGRDVNQVSDALKVVVLVDAPCELLASRASKGDDEEPWPSRSDLQCDMSATMEQAQSFAASCRGEQADVALDRGFAELDLRTVQCWHVAESFRCSSEEMSTVTFQFYEHGWRSVVRATSGLARAI